MLSNTRSTLAIAFAATILGASPALAGPGGDDLRGENAAALSATPPVRARRAAGDARDLRGENAIGVSDPGTPPADDQRSPDAASRSAGRASRSRSWSR